ncbi:MAG: gamma-glutamyltransferase [Phycisphaerales bacterium]
MTHPFTTLAAAALATASLALAQPLAAAQDQSTPPSSRLFERFAVAADHHLASEAGALILAQGGNAVDAAVATSFALSVVRPFSCGIGGGGFMLVFLKAHARLAIDPKGEFFALNYRETCPAAIGPDFYASIGNGASDSIAAARTGGKSIGVPGTVSGLLLAHERWGTGLLDRAAILAPAIRLAREGFAVDAAFHKAAITELLPKFNANPDWKTRFPFVWQRYLREGKLAVGDIIKAPEQAEALELIARDGPAAFYTGPIAQALVSAIAADGGVLTAADLAAYAPADATPLRFRFEDTDFATMPPPSSGGMALAQTLMFLEQAGARRIVEQHPTEPGGYPPHYTHLLAEAFKHAFADRSRYLSDPAFAAIPLARLTSEEYIRERVATFHPTRSLDSPDYGTFPDGTPKPDEAAPEDAGTSHLSVVDGSGNAVACTETINLEFGSLLAVERFGFVLNNEMDDFTTLRGKANAFGLRQSDANLPAPGKRPLSSMSPTIATVSGADGIARVRLVAGASGGPRIITGTAQAILNTLLFNCASAEAVLRPRIHHQWMPNVLEIENQYPGVHNGLPTALWMRKLHHQVKTPKSAANVQLIQRAMTAGGEKWDGASDPRKGGAPAGE